MLVAALSASGCGHADILAGYEVHSEFRPFGLQDCVEFSGRKCQNVVTYNSATQLYIEGSERPTDLCVNVGSKTEGSNKCPKLRSRDDVFGTWLLRLRPNWQPALLIMQAAASSPGIATGAVCNGVGGPGQVSQVDQPSQPKCGPQFDGPRIQPELMLLGHGLPAGDFFTVPSAMFRVFCRSASRSSPGGSL